MYIFALGLIFPALTVNGDDVLYDIVLESKKFHVKSRNCDGCQFHLYHNMSPYGADVMNYDNRSSFTTLKFTLNSTSVTELKSHGITYNVCLVKRVIPTASNGVDKVVENVLYCEQQPLVTFERACVNRDQPQVDQNANLSCPNVTEWICKRVQFKYRIYVETVSGGPCPADEIRKVPKFHLILETTEEFGYGKKCMECFIFLQYGLNPRRRYIQPVGGHTYTLILDSNDVSRLKTDGIYFSVCLNIKQSTYLSTGGRRADDLAYVCHYENNVSFAQACANRYRAKKQIKLAHEDRWNRVTVWENYRFFLQTEHGKPCPLSEVPLLTVKEQNVQYHIILETSQVMEHDIDNPDDHKFRVVHHVLPRGNMTTMDNYTFKITLNSESLTDLKSNGIRYRVCLTERLPQTDNNGVGEVQEKNYVCRHQQSITFAEACANRDNPQAGKYAVLFCPDSIRSTICASVSFTYRIYVETEFGQPCTACDIRKSGRQSLMLDAATRISWIQNCDGCHMYLQYTMNPSGMFVVKHGYSFPTLQTIFKDDGKYFDTNIDTVKFYLDSTMVKNFESNRVSLTVCLQIKQEPTQANGLRATRVFESDCKQEPNVTFAESCVEQYRPMKEIRFRFPIEGLWKINLVEEYRIYVGPEFCIPCPVSEEPFRLSWEVTDIDVRGACGHCAIRPAIQFGKMSLRTESVAHTDLSDEQMWDIIIHGMNYTEMWFVDTHPTELPTNVSYAAEVPGNATVLELCAGITANRVVPCIPDAMGRNICTEISYLLKLLITKRSGEACPSDTFKMLQ